MLKPDEIDAKQFTVRTLRGYDPKEVDAFLDRVASDYRELLASYETLKMEMNRRADAATQPIPVVGDVTRLLAVAQRAADEQIAEANGKAGQIIADATTEATSQRHQIIGQLEVQRAELAEHVKALEAARDAAVSSLKNGLEAIGGPA